MPVDLCFKINDRRITAENNELLNFKMLFFSCYSNIYLSAYPTNVKGALPFKSYRHFLIILAKFPGIILAVYVLIERNPVEGLLHIFKTRFRINQ